MNRIQSVREYNYERETRKKQIKTVKPSKEEGKGITKKKKRSYME